MTHKFQQQYDIDYNETFAPVLRVSTSCLFFALVAAKDLEIPQVDVKTALHNGELDEENLWNSQKNAKMNITENLFANYYKGIAASGEHQRNSLQKSIHFYANIDF